MNHVNYDKRLEFVKSLIQDKFQLNILNINPLDYDPEFPISYNNFVYSVKLSSPTTSASIKPTLSQPGSQPIPDGASVLVVRLSNVAAGLNEINRVQNEVAAMSLVRDALGGSFDSPVPRVYGWASVHNGQSWIIQEYMQGKAQDQAFKTMNVSDKRKILRQMAEVVKVLQRYQLPLSIQGYGGLSFDQSGSIVSAAMTTIHAGPFDTYEALCRAMLQSSLAEAEQSPLLKGWEPNGIRARLNAFIREGVSPTIENADVEKKVLVHSDFTLNNLLFDPNTLRLTAILDLDWAHVASIADEHLRSFGDFDGELPGPVSIQPGQLALRTAFLEGFPPPLSGSDTGIQWEDAQMWDDELARAGADRPRTIKGIAGLSGLHWLAEQICPWPLVSETAVGWSNPAALEAGRKEAEGLLVKYLEECGF